ncbi:MAG: hypothetical protein JXB47_10485 [Anaerolineae bacterium]|nr:hypothetical protein [Anaerolineae bacterium]
MGEESDEQNSPRTSQGERAHPEYAMLILNAFLLILAFFVISLKIYIDGKTEELSSVLPLFLVPASFVVIMTYLIAKNLSSYDQAKGDLEKWAVEITKTLLTCPLATLVLILIDIILALVLLVHFPTNILSTLFPTATPNSLYVDLTLFMDEDSFTLFVPLSDTNVSLEGLEFEVSAKSQTKALSTYESLKGIHFDNLPTPVCFRLERYDSNRSLPTWCGTGQTLFTQSLAGADIFWYSQTQNQGYVVTVLQGETPVGQCQFNTAADKGCTIRWYFELPTPQN